MKIYNMNIRDLDNKKFDLFGSTWTIKIVDNIPKCEDGLSCYGVCNSVPQIIEIAIHSDDTEISEETMFITLCHELVHAIFITGSYINSNNDEPLVEFTARSIVSLLKQGILCK